MVFCIRRSLAIFGIMLLFFSCSGGGGSSGGSGSPDDSGNNGTTQNGENGENGENGSRSCQVEQAEAGDGQSGAPYQYSFSQDCTSLVIMASELGAKMTGSYYYRIDGLEAEAELLPSASIQFRSEAADASEVSLFYLPAGGEIDSLPPPQGANAESIAFVKSMGLSQEESGSRPTATVGGQFNFAVSAPETLESFSDILESFSITIALWKDGILSPPENFRVSAVNTSSVELEWENPQDGDRSGYELSWDPPSSGEASSSLLLGIDATTMVEATTAEIDLSIEMEAGSLEYSTDYQFTLRAISRNGEQQIEARSEPASVMQRTPELIRWDLGNLPVSPARLDVPLGATLAFYCPAGAIASLWYVSQNVFDDCDAGATPEMPLGSDASALKIGECLGAGQEGKIIPQEVKRSSAGLTSTVPYEEGQSFHFISTVPSANPTVDYVVQGQNGRIPLPPVDTATMMTLESQCDAGLKVEIYVTP